MMADRQPTRLFYSFYFGEAAESAQNAASRRLQKWSRAFEAWYSEREGKFSKNAMKQTNLAWRRLVRCCKKMPWEITRQDMEGFIVWMREEGMAARTINSSVGIIASFYDWCEKEKVDRAYPEGFNPAREAERIKIRRYEGAKIWNEEEVKALLGLIKKDSSELGKREYAFFLTRLNTGVALKTLLGLQWGRVEAENGEALVKWREDGKRVRLDWEVWEAIVDYLKASGRLEGMANEKYIFAGLAEPGREDCGSRAEDWVERREISTSTVLTSLKIYGRQAGISEDKLTLMALRRTAIRMKMASGEDTRGMQEFMDSRNVSRITKYELTCLKAIDIEEGGVKFAEREVPDRRAKPFRKGENVTHGLYSKVTDHEAVQKVIEQGISGMDDEVACLRRLLEGIHTRDAHSAAAVEVYSKSAQRLVDLLACDKDDPKADAMDASAEEVLAMWDKDFAEPGQPLPSEEVRHEALSGDWETGKAVSVTTEIATLRVMLGNLYRRAMSGIDDREYLHLVDLYSMVCVRLMRLVRFGGASQAGKLSRYVEHTIDIALKQLADELVKNN